MATPTRRFMLIEGLRRLSRRVLGQDSVAYNAGAKLLTAAAVVRSEGLKRALAIRRIARIKEGITPLLVSGLGQPINVRSGTCDVSAVVDAVVREAYGSPLPAALNPRSMIDAGAYIGDTSVYFLSRFPDLFILALEPEPANFALAAQNLAAYGTRAIALNAALWWESCTLRFSGDFLAGSISAEGHAVAALSVVDALDKLPTRRADILKLDIEGAERDVFLRNSEQWLNRVDHILIELHGPETTREVLAVLEKAGFCCSQYRSIWYCSRRNDAAGYTSLGPDTF